MRTILLAVVLAVLIAPVACANDTALGAVGGVLQPMDQHPSVRMVSEEIHIKLMPDDVAVACRFVFENTGGPVTVKMGFPEDHGGGGGSGFEYFRSKVDGKPVKTTHVRGKWTDEYEGRDWYVKDVRFERGETRIVEDSYGGMAGSYSMGALRYTSYVLTTGKPWVSRIGKAVVIVDVSAIRDYQTMRFSPRGYSRQGDRVTWTFPNFEPEEDISIQYWPGFSNLVVDGRDLSTAPNFTNAEDGPIDVTLYENARTWVLVPRLEDGVLMAPARRLDWMLGVSARPGASAKSVVLSGGAEALSVTAGSITAVLDGRVISLPKAPYLEHGVMMVPVATVGNALGASVRYEPSTGKIHISRLKPHSRS